MFCKLIRLTRDSELRTTQSGKQVLGVSGAYDVGYGDNKRVQYVDFALWEDRGVKAAPHFLKGTAIVVYVDDLYVDPYIKKNGELGSNLKGRIVSFDFAGKSEKPAQESHDPDNFRKKGVDNAKQANNEQAQTPEYPAGFDDFSDNIPFMRIGMEDFV